MQMTTTRIDENAFRIVDYAAQYISARNAHLEALNDLVLSMGPYLTALKAYSTALKSYAAATDEKAIHILNLRDISKYEKTLNDANAIIAFNDLKAGADNPNNKPFEWCPPDDLTCKRYYEGAYVKQHLQQEAVMDVYMEDIKRGHYQTLDNPGLPSGKK